MSVNAACIQHVTLHFMSANAMSRSPLCKECSRDDCNSMNHLSGEYTPLSALISSITLQAPSSVENSLTPPPYDECAQYSRK